MKTVRLLHFDIKTFGNYGDTLLFECVREVFNGFGGGGYFEIHDTRPLRDPVGPSLVKYINENIDAVLVGGGGLFLRDTNPNQNSGWQWNISLEMLSRIEKPLIVFAVGNNRFIGQADFTDIFRRHVDRTVQKSVFFGLRNHGSVETIREYVADERRDQVVYQPCPTTLGSYLYPDLMRDEISAERRVGVQMIVGKRQEPVGFRSEEIYPAVTRTIQRLAAEGWQVDGIAHARADRRYVEDAKQSGVPLREITLYNDSRALYKGVRYYAELPLVVGTRGHAQMIPFGMGSLPLSPFVHHKIGYFAADIGHPEWAIDPRSDGFEDRLYKTVHEVSERRFELRAELANVRAEMMATTVANLATIYEGITGDAVEPGFVAYSPLERQLAEAAYRESMARQRSEQRVRALENARAGIPDDSPANVPAQPGAQDAAAEPEVRGPAKPAGDGLPRTTPRAPSSLLRRIARRVLG